MDAYDIYLTDLPRIAIGADREPLIKKGQPFIELEVIIPKLHFLCETECLTRMLMVHVPQENITFPIEYPHHDTQKPLDACRTAYVQMLTSKGVEGRIIDLMTNTFFKEIDWYSSMYPEERLRQAARAYKSSENYQKDIRQISGLLRLLSA